MSTEDWKVHINRSLGAEGEDEEREFPELAAEFGLSLPLLAPPAALKEKLMAAVRQTPLNPAPGVFVIPARGGDWKSTPWPGVSYKRLFHDRDTEMLTLILKLGPGARYPRHRHAKAEQCLVLSGTVEMGQHVRIAAGDFEWAEAYTEHDELYSSEGCELLIIASRRDEILV